MDDSRVVSKGPCDNCGSSDANALYDDGHSFCFSCQTYTHNKDAGEVSETQAKTCGLIPAGQFKALDKRHISEETCRKWGYSFNRHGEKNCQVATYYTADRKPVAQKLRFPDKTFTVLGDAKNMGLYGQWLWRDGGKMVVVTEGELDALSVSQMQGNRWPVVSVPNGAQGAEKSIKQALEWLNKFDSVIFMFDNDEHGRKAASICAALLPPGKAKTASLPLKDANEMLVARRTKECIDAIWGAKEYRPDGIVKAGDYADSWLTDKEAAAVQWPWGELNRRTLGLRQCEITCLTAGSGIGKSSVCREVAHHLLEQGHSVGYIGLEESVERSLRGIIGVAINYPLHLGVPEERKTEAAEAFERLSPNLFLYDHFGSLNSNNLIQRIRYMATGLGVRWVVLDHISIVISGDGTIENERRAIDVTMTNLRSLVQETGIGMILVSHLKRPEGRGHEEGARVSLAQLRGSAAIAQLSDVVIGCERDQQSEENADAMTLRVLKNRFSGETGEAGTLYYDKDTGRLSDNVFGTSDDTADVGF